MGQRLDFKLRKISETCLEIIQTLFLHVTSSSKLTGILLPIFSRRSNFVQVKSKILDLGFLDVSSFVRGRRREGMNNI